MTWPWAPPRSQPRKESPLELMRNCPTGNQVESNKVALEKRKNVLISAVKALKKNRSLSLGLLVFLLIATGAILGPSLHQVDPVRQDIRHRLMPPAWLPGGSWDHPLGTDQLGRDILSRLMYGARISLAIGFGAVVIPGTYGTILGLVSGYFGGVADTLIMRICELQMAFPFIVLAIIIMAFLSPSPAKIVIVFSITGWVIYGKLVRGLALSLKGREFVEAARAIGCSDARIMFRHILPSVLPSAIVLGTLELSVMILTEAALSFIGIGVQPPTPSWGLMLAEGRNYLSNAWWLATFPGLALMVTVLGVNLMGDGLRDQIDPTLRGSGN